jgi:hypothetical protein
VSFRYYVKPFSQGVYAILLDVKSGYRVIFGKFNSKGKVYITKADHGDSDSTHGLYIKKK